MMRPSRHPDDCHPLRYNEAQHGPDSHHPRRQPAAAGGPHRAEQGRAEGEKVDDGAHAQCLAAAVADVVRKQRELGIDIPDDGEFGKPMGANYDYGAWWNYAFARMEGFAPAESVPESEHKKSSVAELALTTYANRRDWQKFGEFYQDPESSGTLLGQRRAAARRAVRSARRRSNMSAMPRSPPTSPTSRRRWPRPASRKASCARSGREASRAARTCTTRPRRISSSPSAEAMREEYKAIVDAGIVLQIDDPSLPDNWDMINPEPPLAEFKKFERVRIEALNHALRGLPADRIRFHICWGSWHGPHTTDIPLRDIVDLVLSVNAGAYSVEAGNVRHEHEWRVWRDVKLPDGKLLIPGVVSHATNIVEHPQVVADRIVRYAQVVGRENVIAGHRLRIRRPYPSADRLAQAPGIGGGCQARDRRALEIDQPSAHSAASAHVSLRRLRRRRGWPRPQARAAIDVPHTRRRTVRASRLHISAATMRLSASPARLAALRYSHHSAATPAASRRTSTCSAHGPELAPVCAGISWPGAPDRRQRVGINRSPCSHCHPVPLRRPKSRPVRRRAVRLREPARSAGCRFPPA